MGQRNDVIHARRAPAASMPFTAPAGALENDLTVRLVEKSCSEGWARQGSNLRPEDYESPALTTELQAQGLIYKGFLR